jgi:uncharacterized peroxidase-related enzyme
MAWIKVLEKNEADPMLKEIYTYIERRRGKLSNIMKVQSLDPRSIETHMEFYLSIMFSKKGLSRVEREMVGVVVSRINGCEYSVRHHSEALFHYWKDRELVELFAEDIENVELPERIQAMLSYVIKLTLAPGEVTEEDVDLLRGQGFSDKEILNLNLTTSYFNFVNRVAQGLGVEFTEEETKGYKY